MPKKVFWPASLVVMGLVFMAAILDLLPREFLSFWPLLLIIVGLGGLLTSDRDEWMVPTSKKATTKAAPKAAGKTVIKSAAKSVKPATKKIAKPAMKSAKKVAPKAAAKKTVSEKRK